MAGKAAGTGRKIARDLKAIAVVLVIGAAVLAVFAAIIWIERLKRTPLW